MRVLWACLVLVQASLVLPRGSARGRSRTAPLSNDILGRAACPAVRFRRRGCTVRYECENKCENKIQCRTKYQYKCTKYRRQECKEVWQNQCNGKRTGRRKRSPRAPPYWLDLSNTNTIDDAPLPADPSGVPLLSPGIGGQVFDFPTKPRSKSCWKQVRKCEYKVYRTTCGNIPVKTCDDKPTMSCKKKCKNVYYCNSCPKPTTPRPRPTTPRPRPKPTGPPRPTKRPVGPPAPPPQGTFIVSPPSPPKQASPLDTVIDAKRSKRRGRRRP